MIELAVKIEKGEGREGMLTGIDMALIGGGYKIRPGTYRVIIEPAELVEEEATKTNEPRTSVEVGG